MERMLATGEWAASHHPNAELVKLCEDEKPQ